MVVPLVVGQCHGVRHGFRLELGFSNGQNRHDGQLETSAVVGQSSGNSDQRINIQLLLVGLCWRMTHDNQQ